MNISDLAIEGVCVCPVENCKNEFKGSSQLTMHILRHHDGCKLPVNLGQESEYYCPVEGCSRAKEKGQPFPRLGQLKQHYHSVHGKKEFNCERCGKSFGLKDVCNRHQAECGTVIQCLTCEDTFHTRNALYQHAKRKGHKLPSGSKPRANTRTQKSIPSSQQNRSINLVFPITIKQVVSLPSQNSNLVCEAATQTDPEPTPITAMSQTSSFTQYADASTQLVDPRLSVSTNVETLSETEGPSYAYSLNASTNTMHLDHPAINSSLEQLIDASTNTLPVTWADPISRVLVDAGTSTAVSGAVDEEMVDLATQTDIENFLCDLATQTELAHVNIESHDVSAPSTHMSHDLSSQSHDFTAESESGYRSQDFTAGPDFNPPVDLFFPISTRDMSTSTGLSTAEYGAQTSAELDEISQLLSKYDFATQTSSVGCQGDVTSLHQFSDFSTQTQTSMDSCTQTHLVSESSTQTLLDCASCMTDFSSQT